MQPVCLAHAVLGVSAAAMIPPPPVIPDATMVASYAETVFGWCEGWVAVRALAEKGGPERAPHTPFLASDASLAEKLAVQARWAAEAGMALYVIPGTVTAPGQASAEHIAQMQVVLVDLDGGDIAAKRDHLVRHLGQPSLEVASGGVTSGGQEKLHLYWRMTEAASGDDLATVCRLRHAIAVKVGGDPAFRSAHQPIRVAGSIHAKAAHPRLVAIRQAGGRHHDLTEFAEAVLAMPPLAGVGAELPAGAAGDPLDFNGAGTHRGEVAELFGQEVREGGVDGLTRFDALSRIIGYWIRRCQDGVVTAAQAWQEICDYNAARISPPWPEDRLRHEAERLWRRAEASHPAEPQPANDVAGAGDIIDGPDDLLPIGFTEDALAAEFSALHGDAWRHVAVWGAWLTWTGVRWEREGTLRAFDLARHVCRAAANRANSTKVRTRLSQASTVAAVERLAHADRRHAATAEIWDRDPWLLNTPGGIVDLRTGVLAPHDRTLCMTKVTAAAPHGACPA